MKSTVLNWKNKVSPTIFSVSLCKCEIQWGYFKDLSCKFRGKFWLSYMWMFSGGKGWPRHLLPRHWHQVSCLAGLGIFLLVQSCTTPAQLWTDAASRMCCGAVSSLECFSLGFSLHLLVRLSWVFLDLMCTSRSDMTHLMGVPWYRAEEWSLEVLYLSHVLNKLCQNCHVKCGSTFP